METAMRARLVFVLGLLLLAVIASFSASGAAGATTPHTKRVVVRPVRANGTPVADYHVTRENDGSFTCDEVSRVAVSANIRACGPSATYTVACWKSSHHTVLCLRDPRKKELARIPYQGSFSHVAAPKKPSPQALVLGNKRACDVRDGGAWGTVAAHPHWVGFYSCTGKVGDVYGPAKGDGINRKHKLWTVETVSFGATEKITKHRVVKAYYVGTAA
jgi:hypothetical protein